MVISWRGCAVWFKRQYYIPKALQKAEFSGNLAPLTGYVFLALIAVWPFDSLPFYDVVPIDKQCRKNQ